MSVELPERDGDGYLVDMNDWTPEIGRAMAAADGLAWACVGSMLYRGEANATRWEPVWQAPEPIRALAARS